jgi:hypothetical protein
MTTFWKLSAVLPIAFLASSREVPEQQPQCRMEVVHCNYGALYSGTVSWSKSLITQQSTPSASRLDRRVDSVRVTVSNGRATCAGTVEENRNSTGDVPTRGKLRAAITGPALFAVEFDKDANGKLYYLVTVACASEAGTDSTFDTRTGAADGNDIISTPPALDGREMQSDKQPATAVGIDLAGRITFTHPDEDRLNGVTGTVTVRWDLKRR